MNRIGVGLLGYVLLGIQLAATEVLTPGVSGVAPNLVLPLVVFVALFTRTVPAVWVAVLLGLMFDLTRALPTGEVGAGAVHVVAGPYALGYAAAAVVTVQMRGLLVQRNPLALVLATAIGSVIADLVAGALLGVRSLHDSGFEWDRWFGVWQVLGRAGFAAGSAAVLAPVLLLLIKTLGLSDRAGTGFQYT